MPRSSGTQTRTFVYTGADMNSVTNPENGTVTYTYDVTHHVTTRTDARGQQTQYDYDAYGRVTEVRHGYLWGGTFIEYSNQRADYTYDQGQNGLGRLTSVQFGRNDGLGFAPANPFTYSYVYNQAGRVMTQNLTTSMSNPGYAVPLYLTASYQWDNEGRMTQVAYPAVCWAAPCYPGTPPIPVYAMQYDNVGRLNGMTEDLQDGNGTQGVATAGYGPAGQLLNLSYFGVNETRTDNRLLELTRMTATGLTGARLTAIRSVSSGGGGT